MSTAREIYDGYEEAYKYFNKHLFGERLHGCVLVTNRKKGAYAYFNAKKWVKEGQLTGEISINPDYLGDRPPMIALSTLVHEMCHQYQHEHGKPSRGGYHNKEWAGFMVGVGLIPSTTGKPGGEQIGQSVSHYIEPNGLFENTCKTFLKETNFELAVKCNKNPKNTNKNKTKFTCPHCKLNAWAKPSASLLCGDCGVQLVQN